MSKFIYDPAYAKRNDVLANMCSVIERAGKKLEITVKEPTRSSDQNKRLWGMLGDISKQVQWSVNGKMRYLSSDDWKDIFSASLKQEQEVTPTINGTGFVFLGQRTSKMTKQEMSDLQTLIQAFGDERGVQWSERVEDWA